MAWPHGVGGGMVWLVCCVKPWPVGGGGGVYVLALFGGVRMRSFPRSSPCAGVSSSVSGATLCHHRRFEPSVICPRWNRFSFFFMDWTCGSGPCKNMLSCATPFAS